jgi:voltage-gated potassium channel
MALMGYAKPAHIERHRPRRGPSEVAPLGHHPLRMRSVPSVSAQAKAAVVIPKKKAAEVMRVSATPHVLTRADHAARRDIAAAAVRICLGSALLFGVFALAPLELRGDDSWAPRLALSVALLAVVVITQIMAVTRSPYPRLRAVEAVAACVPLLIVLFAATYFAMDQADASSFNEAISRTDAVYLTVTVFASVGFGDIVATSESARLAVTVQMIVNMLLIGVIAKVLFGAVQQRRAALSESPVEGSDRADKVAD